MKITTTTIELTPEYPRQMLDMDTRPQAEYLNWIANLRTVMRK
ncbi:MAG TPA: hypothetical protein O0X50_00280 [Methanocorpusculum sp.]|nr:hypothetical protein [Methanocorpusculum sp.]